VEVLHSKVGVPRVSRKWYNIPNVVYAGCELDQPFKA
jgi:hypothetical protein